MAYSNNAFCWHGIETSDVDRAVSFYKTVLGWDVEMVDMGGNHVPTMMGGGAARAHVAPTEGGTPSQWTHYLRVDDVDVRTTLAEKHGGKVLVQPTDIAPGRFSVVTSPSGAPVRLFHEVDESSAENGPSGPGAIHWVELWSKGAEADLRWLEGALGIASREMEMPNGPYHILSAFGSDVGGAMSSDVEEAPSMWLAWVEVDDVDAAVAKADSSGGTVQSPPFDVPGVGRLAVVLDPTGAAFGVIKP